VDSLPLLELEPTKEISYIKNTKMLQYTNTTYHWENSLIRIVMIEL